MFLPEVDHGSCGTKFCDGFCTVRLSYFLVEYSYFIRHEQFCATNTLVAPLLPGMSHCVVVRSTTLEATRDWNTMKHNVLNYSTTGTRVVARPSH